MRPRKFARGAVGFPTPLHKRSPEPAAPTDRQCPAAPAAALLVQPEFRRRRAVREDVRVAHVALVRVAAVGAERRGDDGRLGRRRRRWSWRSGGGGGRRRRRGARARAPGRYGGGGVGNGRCDASGTRRSRWWRCRGEDCGRREAGKRRRVNVTVCAVCRRWKLTQSWSG